MSPPQENFVHFKVKCITLEHFESSKLRAWTGFNPWTDIEQRKSLDLYLDIKECRESRRIKHNL